MLQKQCEGGLHWLEFELLAEFKNLTHALFLRTGGVSQPPFHSLNFSYVVGDAKPHVDANRQKASQLLHVPFVPLQMSHSKIVHRVTHYSDREYQGDALTTSQANMGLLITHADCQAAIFYDPQHHALANVHCGWRGNVQNIYAETVQHMKACYSSSPQDLLVCISPSLGPDEAEFIHYKTELPEPFWEYQCKPNHFNLWEISKAQLLACGILPHHIQIAEISTFAHPEHYFSFRRDKTCGRNATVAVLG